MSDDELKAAVESYFEGLDKCFYLEGMQVLEKRLTKCVELGGSYVEK